MIDFDATYDTITPELAEELLRKNKSNRPLTEQSIQKYAEQMKQGAFKANGEPIIISDQDTLLNGQHRLHAVIRSGVSIKSLIVYNVPIDSFDTIDTGRARGGSDVYAISGLKNYRTGAAIARSVVSYRKGKVGVPNIANAPTNHEIILFSIEHPDLEDVASLSESRRKNFPPITAAEFGLMHYVLSEIDQEQAKEFIELTCSGLNLNKPEHSAIAELRSRMIRNSSSKAKLPKSYRLALIITAWNYFREKTEVKLLRYSTDSPFPVPI